MCNETRTSGDFLWGCNKSHNDAMHNFRVIGLTESGFEKLVRATVPEPVAVPTPLDRLTYLATKVAILCTIVGIVAIMVAIIGSEYLG